MGRGVREGEEAIPARFPPGGGRAAEFHRPLPWESRIGASDRRDPIPKRAQGGFRCRGDTPTKGGSTLNLSHRGPGQGWGRGRRRPAPRHRRTGNPTTPPPTGSGGGRGCGGGHGGQGDRLAGPWGHCNWMDAPHRRAHNEMSSVGSTGNFGGLQFWTNIQGKKE